MFTIIGADGKEYGPVTAANITDWIAAGRANLQTKARRDGETDWKTLGDFAEFAAPPVLAAAATPPIPGVSPAQGTPTPDIGLASRWLRLGAILLDNIIAGIFVAPGFVILMAAGAFTHANGPFTPLFFGGIAVIGAAVLLLIGIQMYLLTTRGQTIGKKLLGIKIVNFEDGTNPGFVKAVLLRALVNGLFGAVPFIGMFYALADIFFIFRDDRRCIHDLLAGTKVVPA